MNLGGGPESSRDEVRGKSEERLVESLSPGQTVDCRHGEGRVALKQVTESTNPTRQVVLPHATSHPGKVLLALLNEAELPQCAITPVVAALLEGHSLSPRGPCTPHTYELSLESGHSTIGITQIGMATSSVLFHLAGGEGPGRILQASSQSISTLYQGDWSWQAPG